MQKTDWVLPQTPVLPFLLQWLLSMTMTILELLQADAKPIESCLSDGSIGMSRAIMEAIASGSVVTVVDVKRFVECTLLAATEDFQASSPPYIPPRSPSPLPMQSTLSLATVNSHTSILTAS